MNNDLRKVTHKTKEELRIKAVQAVIEQGKKQIEVAAFFGVKREVVCRWIKIYKEGGYNALKAKPKGRPQNSSRLKPWQAATIVKTITEKTPDQVKFPFMLWTRDCVAELIEKKYGIHMSRWTVGRLLKKWGLTPQKPQKKSYFQDSEKVKSWLEENYPALVNKAKKEKGEIQWLDEMGARSDDQTGRTYSKKGQTPVVKVSGVRFSCNFIKSITNLGKLRFMSYTEKFTSDVFIIFLKRLVKDTDKKIFLVLDSHPVHKSKKVSQWVLKNKESLELHFLPPYSPDLNPAEYLNQDVKANSLRRMRAKNLTELKNNISNYLRKKQKCPEKIKRFFQAEKVRYAA
jgi:transposase